MSETRSRSGIICMVQVATTGTDLAPLLMLPRTITSIDQTNNILNVSGALHFSAGAAVVKRDCTYLPGYYDSAWYDTFNPPITDYYGYFNSKYWYTSSSNGFDPSAPKLGSGLSGARAKASAEWDGNFLNWLTMRRTDVVRKVLTGGAFTGSGSNKRLKAELADCDGRGTVRRVPNAELYSDVTGSAQTRCFRVQTAGRESAMGEETAQRHLMFPRIPPAQVTGVIIRSP